MFEAASTITADGADWIMPSFPPEPTIVREKSGHGECSLSGCLCPGYAGNGMLCSNCGHHYDSHH